MGLTARWFAMPPEPNRHQAILEAYDAALAGRDEASPMCSIGLRRSTRQFPMSPPPRSSPRSGVAVRDPSSRERVRRSRQRRADRDRRYRARKSRCVAVVPIEVDGDIVNFLLRRDRFSRTRRRTDQDRRSDRRNGAGFEAAISVSRRTNCTVY